MNINQSLKLNLKSTTDWDQSTLQQLNQQTLIVKVQLVLARVIQVICSRELKTLFIKWSELSSCPSSVLLLLTYTLNGQ